MAKDRFLGTNRRKEGHRIATLAKQDVDMCDAHAMRQKVQWKQDVETVQQILAIDTITPKSRDFWTSTAACLQAHPDRMLANHIRESLDNQLQRLLTAIRMRAQGVPDRPIEERGPPRTYRPSRTVIDYRRRRSERDRDTNAVSKASPWTADPALLPKSPPGRK